MLNKKRITLEKYYFNLLSSKYNILKLSVAPVEVKVENIHKQTNKKKKMKLADNNLSFHNLVHNLLFILHENK